MKSLTLAVESIGFHGCQKLMNTKSDHLSLGENNKKGSANGHPPDLKLFPKPRVLAILTRVHWQLPSSPSLGRQPAIIGLRGIFTAEDAYEKIKAGASAVQIYMGFVYEGPAAVKRINRGLIRLMERDGFRSIAEAVASDN
jgi:hypothetical protein